MSEHIIDGLSLTNDPRSPLAVGRNTDIMVAYQYNRPPISRRNICKARLVVRGVGPYCGHC